METYNVVLVRRSAMTITFQSEGWGDAMAVAKMEMERWNNNHGSDPVVRCFMNAVGSNDAVLEYTAVEIAEEGSRYAARRREPSYDERIRAAGRGSFHRGGR